jgi:hypothetical protein
MLKKEGFGKCMSSLSRLKCRKVSNTMDLLEKYIVSLDTQEILRYGIMRWKLHSSRQRRILKYYLVMFTIDKIGENTLKIFVKIGTV